MKWKSGRRGLAWLWGWGGEELNTCSCCFLSSLVAFDIPLFIELIFVLHCSHISLVRKLLLSSFTQILFLNMPNHSCPQILCISKKIYQSNLEFRDLALWWWLKFTLLLTASPQGWVYKVHRYSEKYEKNPVNQVMLLVYHNYQEERVNDWSSHLPTRERIRNEIEV